MLIVAAVAAIPKVGEGGGGTFAATLALAFAFVFVLVTTLVGWCSRRTIPLVIGLSMGREHFHLVCCPHRCVGLDLSKEAYRR